jgi:hypothetical protein
MSESSSAPASTPATDLRTQLTEELDEAELEWLKPHIHRDMAIVVAPGLDLIEVSIAIATDNTDSIQAWIANGSIAKPSAQLLALWNARTDLKFMASIVQPFVLVQEIPVGEGS